MAFAFSSYNPIIITAGHTTKMLDIGYIPAILAGIMLAYRGKYWQGAAISGLVLSFFFDSGHFQIIYYTVLVIGVLVIAYLIEALKNKRLKNWVFASATLALGASFAMMTNASKIMMTQAYNPQTIRGGNSELSSSAGAHSGGLDRDYAFQWSNGVGETFCLLVPNLYGGASGEDIGPDSHMGKKLSAYNVPPNYVAQMTQRAPLYWGPQPMLSGPVYFGAVICLLVVLALLLIRSPAKWWLAGISFFFILLSMGKNFPAFNNFMFDYLPMYNKFRTPSMSLAIPSVLFPILGIWALRDIFQEKVTKEFLWKKLKTALIITGGLCVLLLLAAQGYLDFKGAGDAQIAQQYGQMFQNPQIGEELVTALREDRAAAATADALRSLVFVLLAAGVLWAFAKGKIKKEMAVAGIGLLVAVDLLPVANRYLNKSDYLDDSTYAMQFQPRPVDAQIMQDKDPYYRVFDLTSSPFNDSKPSYFHKSIGGYSGAKLEIYQELIENQLGHFNTAVLNMLNTKYLIVPGQGGTPSAQLNPDACGNAWFVQDIKWVADADAEMKALDAPSLQNPMDTTAGNFEPLKTAIIRESQRAALGEVRTGKDSISSVTLSAYGPRRLAFESNNAQDGFAVFSDIYYPTGWIAKIDGQEVPIIRTNYVLRGLAIPAGQHKIEFSYEPKNYATGQSLGLIGSILLSLLLLAAVLLQFRADRLKAKKAGK